VGEPGVDGGGRSWWRRPEVVEEAGRGGGGRTWWRRPEVVEEAGGVGGGRRTLWPSVAIVAVGAVKVAGVARRSSSM
jgi:hypothetical protein